MASMSEPESSVFAAGSSTGLETDPEARLWGMLAHLAALLGFVVPFGNIIGPLIIWQIKKDAMPFVDDQGRESLNFQITVTLALLACAVLIVVLIGVVLMPLVGLAALVLVVIAAIKANGGERYRYPFCLRLVT